MPSRLQCRLSISDDWLEEASTHGHDEEIGFLREMFSWSVSWTELHGVTEVKKPLFKMCFQHGSNGLARVIKRLGAGMAIEGAVSGLQFPFGQPVRRAKSDLSARVLRN